MQHDRARSLASYERHRVHDVRAFNTRPGSRIIICPDCQTKNRLPPSPHARCGKCKHVFSTLEVQQAVLGNAIGLPKDAALPRQVWDDETDAGDEDEEADDE